MKKRSFLVLSIILSLALIGTSPVLAKEIKVLAQFPMSGIAGNLPEFGWGFIDGMNWISPMAPLPAALQMLGLNVSPDSNAMQDMSQLACVSRFHLKPSQMANTLSRKA